MDKISVIIPVYNVEKYLDRCIESVVNQTYKNLEIILVDDGSLDNCPQICDEWAKKDDRIIVVHKKNGGLSDARNAGMQRATGKYCAFLDSDDYIDKKMYEKLYETLIKDKSDMSMCTLSIVDTNGNEQCCIDDIESGTFSKDKILEFYTEENWWQYVSACTKLFKTELIYDIKFPKGKLNEDAFVMHEFFDRCETISVLNEKLYYYVQTSNSITRSNITVRNLDDIEAIYKKYIFYKKNGHGKYLDGIRRILVGKYFAIFSKFKIKKISDFKRYNEVKKMMLNMMKCDLSPFHGFSKIHLWVPLLFGICHRIKNKMR